MLASAPPNGSDMTATSTSTRAARVAPSPRANPPSQLRQPRPVPPLRVVGEPQRRRIPVFALLVSLVVLGSLFSLAVFHTWMVETQFELNDIEGRLAVQRGRLADLEFQVERYNAPGSVEGLARGQLGMIDPGEPVDILVTPELMAEIGAAEAAHRRPVLEAVPGTETGPQAVSGDDPGTLGSSVEAGPSGVGGDGP